MTCSGHLPLEMPWVKIPVMNLKVAVAEVLEQGWSPLLCSRHTRKWPLALQAALL